MPAVDGACTPREVSRASCKQSQYLIVCYPILPYSRVDSSQDIVKHVHIADTQDILALLISLNNSTRVT